MDSELRSQPVSVEERLESPSEAPEAGRDQASDDADQNQIGTMQGLMSDAASEFRTLQRGDVVEGVVVGGLTKRDVERLSAFEGPRYRIAPLKVTVDGDRGTLRFECHFIEVDTGKVAAVTAGSLDVQKIDERWLITNFVGSTSELKI